MKKIACTVSIAQCCARCGALVFLLASAQAADWPQYRGIAGDGVSAEALNNVEWPAKGPREVWKIETPTGFSSFAVAGGRAFTLVARTDAAGDSRETCLAVDAATGNRLWEAALGTSDYGHGGGDAGAPGNRGGDGPRSTPACDDSRVWVYDAHLVLSCLDASTGEVIWQRDIAKLYDGRNIGWLNAVSPLIEGNTLYVPGGGSGQSFLAFDKNSGELIWKSGDETMTHATPRLATIRNVRQLVFYTQFGLVSVAASDGKELWRTKMPFQTSSAASPVVARDLVYASAGYGVGAGLFRVSGATDEQQIDNVWFKINKLMNHWSTPVYYKGHLYGIYGHKKYGKAPLQCVDLETGEVKWSERGFGAGNCILVGDKLVVLSDYGQLTVAEATPQGYVELASAELLDGKCWSTPAFSDGKVFIRSTKEGACFDLTAAP